MATLILTTAAQFFIPGGWQLAVAETAAAIAGSYIDTKLFAPQIHNEGPRLSDLTVQISSYGQPIPRVYGAENRISGNVIWSTGLKETKSTSTQGGKGGGTSKTTSFTYAVDCAIALCLGPIVAVRRIWADGKLFMDAAGVQKQAHAVRVYLGDNTQAADPLIQAAVGVDKTPAYRGTAYVVFEELQLADFGNRIPLFTFEVDCGLATAATIVSNLCFAAGLAQTDLEVGGIEGLDVRGYSIGQPSTARDAFQPLRQALFFDVAEREGRLSFFFSDGAPAWNAPVEQLAAHSAGQARPRNYELTRSSDVVLPRQVTIQFNDPARDYQTNAAQARRTLGLSAADVSTQLAITMDANTGKAIAEKTLRQAQRRQDGVTCALPTRFLFAEPGDKIVLPFDDGKSRTLRIERKSTFTPGRIELETLQDGAASLTKVAVAAQTSVPAQAVNLPGQAFLELMDLPILRDEDDGPGFYAAGTSWRAGYIGAVLDRSTDAGATYDRFADLPSLATFGTAVSGLSATAASEYWDEASVVIVTLLRALDTLDSVTAAQVLNGANACLIGDEVIQFRTATLIAPIGGLTAYQLSGLLRGRKGTEDQIALAIPNRRFVLLNGGTVVRTAGALSDVGLSRKFKAVSIGTTVADAAAVDFTNTGRGMKPLAPVHLAGYRAAGPGGDLAVSWTRRTRLDATWRDLVDAPIGEERELYQTDILNGVTVVRTVETTAPGFTYLAADQAADFGGAAPATVSVKTYQISARVGRGFAAAATL